MNLLFAAVVGILFGSGIYLITRPDLFRVVVGMVLLSHATNLTLMASRLTGGQAPVMPFDAGAVADPLVQALTLTALVIGFAITALLLALAYRVYATHRSVDLDDLSRSETRSEHAQERADAIEEEPESDSEVAQR